MKKISTITAVIFFSIQSVYAQSPDSRPNLNGLGSDFNQLRDYANNWKNNTLKSISIDELKKEAKGTPYYDDKFYTAKMNQGIFVPDKLRFNVYSNNMEFLKDGLTYEVNKFDGLEIYLIEANSKYRVQNITLQGKNELRFLKILVEGKYTIFENLKIELKGGTGSKNGIVDNTTLVFTPKKSDYYIAVENELNMLPTKSNDLISFLRTEEEKNKAQKFISEQKINLKKEQDVIALFRYLNQ